MNDKEFQDGYQSCMVNCRSKGIEETEQFYHEYIENGLYYQYACGYEVALRDYKNSLKSL